MITVVSTTETVYTDTHNQQLFYGGERFNHLVMRELKKK